MKNGDPNLSANGDLVADVHTLESGRKCHGSNLAKEAGIDLPDTSGSVH